MPTASKLVAALMLALLAMIVSEQFKPQMPVGYNFGNFTFVNAGLALWIGWTIIGRSAERGGGKAASIATGLTGVITLIAVLVFYHSARLMFIQSTNLRYDSLMQALQDMVRLTMENSLLLATTEIITTLGIGAVLIGLASHAVARRWS